MSSAGDILRQVKTISDGFFQELNNILKMPDLPASFGPGLHHRLIIGFTGSSIDVVENVGTWPAHEQALEMYLKHSVMNNGKSSVWLEKVLPCSGSEYIQKHILSKCVQYLKGCPMLIVRKLQEQLRDVYRLSISKHRSEKDAVFIDFDLARYLTAQSVDTFLIKLEEIGLGDLPCLKSNLLTKLILNFVVKSDYNLFKGQTGLRKLTMQEIANEIQSNANYLKNEDASNRLGDVKMFVKLNLFKPFKETLETEFYILTMWDKGPRFKRLRNMFKSKEKKMVRIPPEIQSPNDQDISKAVENYFNQNYRNSYPLLSLPENVAFEIFKKVRCVSLVRMRRTCKAMEHIVECNRNKIAMGTQIQKCINILIEKNNEITFRVQPKQMFSKWSTLTNPYQQLSAIGFDKVRLFFINITEPTSLETINLFSKLKLVVSKVSVTDVPGGANFVAVEHFFDPVPSAHSDPMEVYFLQGALEFLKTARGVNHLKLHVTYSDATYVIEHPQLQKYKWFTLKMKGLCHTLPTKTLKFHRNREHVHMWTLNTSSIRNVLWDFYKNEDFGTLSSVLCMAYERAPLLSRQHEKFPPMKILWRRREVPPRFDIENNYSYFPETVFEMKTSTKRILIAEGQKRWMSVPTGFTPTMCRFYAFLVEDTLFHKRVMDLDEDEETIPLREKHNFEGVSSGMKSRSLRFRHYQQIFEPYLLNKTC